jgi:hypothetical protein
MIALIKELRQRWWMSHDMQGKGSSGVGIGRGRSVAMQAKVYYNSFLCILNAIVKHNLLSML